MNRFTFFVYMTILVFSLPIQAYGQQQVSKYLPRVKHENPNQQMKYSFLRGVSSNGAFLVLSNFP